MPIVMVLLYRNFKFFWTLDNIVVTMYNRVLKVIYFQSIPKTFQYGSNNYIFFTYVDINCNAGFILCISVKPTAVSILDKISHVSADKEVEVTCQAVGGYPSPKLTWWLGSKILRHFDEVSCLALRGNLVNIKTKIMI